MFLKKYFSRDFSIVVLPDTQFYSESYPEIFMNQTLWIANNSEKENILFVIHLGDIVNIPENLQQWKNAKKSMDVLENNNIPYSVLPGNHDFPLTNYNKTFPISKFLGKKYFGGNFDSMKNSYYFINLGMRKFMILSIGFCPTDEDIKWANNLLKNYSSFDVILATHAYLDDLTSTTLGVHGCRNGNTTYIWNDLIKKNKNIFLVLSGHEHDILHGGDGKAFRVDFNDHKRKVYQFLRNYQFYDSGGSGYLIIIKFYTKENKFSLREYSPYLDKGSEEIFYFYK